MADHSGPALADTYVSTLLFQRSGTLKRLSGVGVGLAATMVTVMVSP
jgi:hypothetical protein